MNGSMNVCVGESKPKMVAGHYLLNEMVSCVFNAIGIDTDDIFKLIEPVDLDRYIQLRASINNAFNAGAIDEFRGFVDEDTEIGDISDCFISLLAEFYPGIDYESDTCVTTVTLEEKQCFRDTFIDKLDLVVGKINNFN